MRYNEDALADRRAARQLGLLRRTDAMACGLTRHQINHRLRTGQWELVATGLYVVKACPPSWQQSTLAACMAATQPAVASHLSAAALWGLIPPPLVPHVTIPPGGNARSPRGQVHRSRITKADRTQVGPIPVTTVARTLLDCASTTPAETLRATVDAAFDSGLVTRRKLDDTLGRVARGTAGTVALRAAASPWLEPIRPGSPAEARLIRRLRQWGMATPSRQHHVLDATGRVVARIDLAWPLERLGLEYDGGEWHRPRRFEADEARHATLVAMGWQLIHTDRLDLRPGDERLRHEIEHTRRVA